MLVSVLLLVSGQSSVQLNYRDGFFSLPAVEEVKVNRSIFHLLLRTMVE